MIEILALHSNNIPDFNHTVAESVLRGTLRVPESFRPSVKLKRLGLLGKVLYASLNSDYDRLGYVNDWKISLANYKYARVDFFNVANLVRSFSAKRKLSQYDLIIILHSAFGDDINNVENFTSALLDRKCSLAVFIGNEYSDIKRKKAFLRAADVNYICTQLPSKSASVLYSDIDGANVLEMPHALNPKRYYFDPRHIATRNIDFAFRGAIYPDWIGDTERNDFIMHLIDQLRARNARLDVKFENENATDWAKLLRSASGTFGAEAGTYFLDSEGLLIERMRTMSESEGYTDFSSFIEATDIEHQSGKAISSRHFEAVGCGTAQILLEGAYNNILRPDIDYFSVRRDFSNLAQKLDEFFDEERRRKIILAAGEHILSQHTYNHRIEKLLRETGLG